MATLYVNDSGEFREASVNQILQGAEAALARRFRVGSQVLNKPSAVRSFLRVHLAVLPYEVFCCLYLDARHRLIAHEELFRGTIDGATVHPREVVRCCLQHDASALIVVHNHPSGVAEPSAADEHITRAIQAALALIDVRLLDHWIVGEAIYSFAEHGLM